VSEVSGQDNNQPVDRDLFGAPLTQIRERWGRPAFAKNTENQQLVATLISAGWSQARIARYLGCDEKTLRKHFSREIEAGTDLVEGMVLQVLVQKMRGGHVPSANKLLEIIDEKGRPAPPQRGSESKPDKLGKKAQANLDAQTPPAESGWAQVLQ
jgi:lambda repressor-like predicted transcriptional regulator